ncbi:MAG: metal ABC transporter permease [Planctomycetaceae bacterium]|nr:metal ABC transporter permease [Planctomycetaceae bacterium]
MNDWLIEHVADIKIAATAAVAAMSCALPGTWLLLRRQSMMGDALSHTALPGIVIAMLAVEGARAAGWIDRLAAPAQHLTMLAGAVAIGVLTAVVTELVQHLGRVEAGASLGVVFTWFFALGLFLLRLAADTAHIDPDCVLFGALENSIWDEGVPTAVWINGTVFAINLALMLLCFKELMLSAFDPGLANAQGINAHVMHYGLMAATAMTVVAAFESVGSILVVGLLIIPAATAQLLTTRLKTMLFLSVLVAGISGVSGHVLARTLPSLILPRFGLAGIEDVSTSGMVPVVAALLFVAAWLLSPRQGLIGTFVSQARLAIRIAGDDLLGLLYRMEERRIADAAGLAPALVAQRLGLGRWLTWLSLQNLRRSDMLTLDGDACRLTDRGRHKARSLVRSHRLWESYLQKHFALAEDHLHAPAHRAEHYIDDSLRSELESELASPTVDPHGSAIPDSEWPGKTNSK